MFVPSIPKQLKPEVILQKDTVNLILCPNFQSQFEKSGMIINGKLFGVEFDEMMNPESIGIGQKNQKYIFGMDQPGQCINWENYHVTDEDNLNDIEIHLYYESRQREATKSFSKKKLEQVFKDNYSNCLINNEQYLDFMMGKAEFTAHVIINDEDKQFGRLKLQTKITVKPEPYQDFVLLNYDSNQEKGENSSEASEHHNENQTNYLKYLDTIEIGGMKEQLETIARKVFASRNFGNQIVQRFGINHSKGILFYGPPGTGKTRMARQISKVFDIKPTIVNGPQIMDKFVGESQRKLRELFEPAKKQWKEKGNDSSLHILIFDEFDAIARRRGNDSAIGDSLVNQLLTEIDGVDSPKNILIIAITNRKDLIDEALLRPGRLEVHIQVFLPDQKGRKEIFEIHTKKLRQQKALAEDVQTSTLAVMTNNFTGAEIQQMVRDASNYVTIKAQPSKKDLKIFLQHFELARNDIVPQFGQDEKAIDSIIPRKDLNIPIKKYAPQTYKELIKWFTKCKKLDQGKMTLLLKGQNRSGKSGIAASCSKQLGLPFTKFVSCDKIFHLNESQKIQFLIKVHQDSKRCQQSCIVFDDLLRMIEFVELDSSYNKKLRQLIVDIVKSAHEEGKKSVIIATCDSFNALDKLGISGCFEDVIQIPQLSKQSAEKVFKAHGIDEQIAERNEISIGYAAKILQEKNKLKFIKGQVYERSKLFQEN